MVQSPVVVESPWILETLQTKHSYRSSGDESPSMLDNNLYGLAQPAREAGIVRLEMDNRPIGVFWAARTDEILFTETDLIWLECMADQVVIALQHALMTSQLQSLSITEERSRIAREMHDGLAQVLGYLNLQVQTLDALLKQGKQKDLAMELEQMRNAIKIANADVRENILSLRTTLANEKGLVSAIGEYLQEFGVQAKIATHFTNEAENNLRLSSIAEVQLVCILQEALANVRKHAYANLVSVLVTKKNRQEGEYIYLQIVDDGIGLLKYDSKRHFGLTTMKERASSVGGNLDVVSGEGKGTKVECWLPCLDPDRIKNSQTIITN
jgi:nitrate/nitrite-specific signal transduction histidine kinase